MTDHRPPTIPTVDVVTAERLRREAVDGPAPLIVDVREIGEIVQVRVEDVVVMPLSQFALRFRELPTDRPAPAHLPLGEPVRDGHRAPASRTAGPWRRTWPAG